MPIGNPMESETAYIEGGRVRRIWITSIPVSDLQRAIDFYVCVLDLPLQLDARQNNWLEVGPDEPGSKIGLFVPPKADKRQPGGPTGVVLETDSIFEFHRRLVDEEVVFKLKPEKRGLGELVAIFLDPDGNELQVMEDPERYSRRPKPAQPEKLDRSERERGCRLR